MPALRLGLVSRVKILELNRKRNALSRAVTQSIQTKLTRDRTEVLVKFNENDLKMSRAIRVNEA